MNYTEKIDQKVEEVVAQMKEELKKMVKEVAVESFKNGIEVGKVRKGRASRQSGKEETDEAVTPQPDVELSA